MVLGGQDFNELGVQKLLWGRWMRFQPIGTRSHLSGSNSYFSIGFTFNSLLPSPLDFSAEVFVETPDGSGNRLMRGTSVCLEYSHFLSSWT